MNVLSLFDGISCGMVALERTGIPVEKYTAFEIDKYALTVSEKNYPQIEHLGNVFDGDYKKYKGYDLLLGGSPCTYWSISRRNREITADGEGFKLFMEYVRALEESNCSFFLYENNYSIHKNIKDEISKQLGVQPIMINSSLLSAQHRKRCYWTNITSVSQPTDKGLVVKDILESGIAVNDVCGKSRTIKAQYSNTSLANVSRQDNLGATMVAEPIPINLTKDGKCRTLRATIYKDGVKNLICNDIDKRTCVANSIKVGEIGKGGQGQRIYSVDGKSVTLSANGGGQGAKTGLYKIDLPDGNYIIRKLYPIEAERLQTLPDNYTEGVSNTQRYKCIGNGWTVDVVAHILKNIY